MPKLLGGRSHAALFVLLGEETAVAVDLVVDAVAVAVAFVSGSIRESRLDRVSDTNIVCQRGAMGGRLTCG